MADNYLGSHRVWIANELTPEGVRLKKKSPFHIGLDFARGMITVVMFYNCILSQYGINVISRHNGHKRTSKYFSE